MKNQVLHNKFIFGSFRLRIQTNLSDPDPYPEKRFEFFRIRIHNNDRICQYDIKHKTMTTTLSEFEGMTQ